MATYTAIAARKLTVLSLGLAFVFSGATVSLASDRIDKKNSQAAGPASVSDVPRVSAETEADLLGIHHRYADAIEAYKKLTPQSAEIDNKIGVAYEHLSMEEEAKYYFRSALKKDKKLADAYNNLATVYYHEKNYELAAHLYKLSLRANSRNAAVYSNLGTLYMARKRYRDGAEAYQRAFSLDSNVFQEASEGVRDEGASEDLAAMNYCFAKIYAQAGMNTLALEYLHKAIIAGFHDRNGLQNEEEFAGLRKLPEFQALVSGQSR
jgi:tetratricopeptide (TPR) repeat protein